MAVPELRRFTILQAQRATSQPYCAYAVDVNQLLGPWERLLHRLLPADLSHGLALWRRRNRFDVVVTAHYRTALLFGLLSNWLGRRCIHIVKELYLDEQVLHKRWTRWLFRRALRRCECIITNCAAEIPAYSAFLNLPAERFRFLPWPSNLPLDPTAPDAGYVFAAGRSFRDWPVLFAAARALPAATFVVVAETAAVAALEKPANVTLYCDVSRARYLELLRGARLVVVPLLPTVRSTGQAVLLEAMALGKPVLAARTPGVVDYLREGQTGLFYEAGNPRSLAEQLDRLLTNPQLRHTLRQGALHAIRTRFNKVRYGQAMLQLVHTLLATRWPPDSLVGERLAAHSRNPVGTEAA